jgi:N-acetylmuramoyl-L-alanine amidase
MIPDPVASSGDGGVRTKNFVDRPARNDRITGVVRGAKRYQYDYTPQQYDSLTRLTATLCTIFPRLTCDYPRQKTELGPPTARRTMEPAASPTTMPEALAGPCESGELVPHTLTDDQWAAYQGILGHYHVQTNKEDPGPAFQWD